MSYRTLVLTCSALTVIDVLESIDLNEDIKYSFFYYINEWMYFTQKLLFFFSIFSKNKASSYSKLLYICWDIKNISARYFFHESWNAAWSQNSLSFSNRYFLTAVCLQKKVNKQLTPFFVNIKWYFTAISSYLKNHFSKHWYKLNTHPHIKYYRTII